MRRYILRRLLLMIPVLLLITVAVASMMRLVPGDPATLALGQAASAKDRQAFRHAYHLDDSLPVQYLRWWSDVLHGDLGRSVVHRTTVSAELRSRLPSTLELVVLGTLFTVILGIPLGVLSAVKRNSAWDYAIRVFSIGGQSVPGFWLGTLLLILPAIWWNYLPPIGKVSLFDNPARNLQQYYLPALVLAIGGSAGIMRLERSTVLEVLRNDYVRTAYAKGLAERRVIVGHVLKNSLIPVVTVIGLQIAALFGGAVILETIFNLPGVGLLFIDSIYVRDYPVIQGLTFFLAVILLLANLVVDLSYAWLDPRIRYT
ncbi:MAG TPA: ABC transporter permease [Dehalococcoidia bacterium]|nr:ABC transporter permease [Dehalococcoidia bacterium]